MSLRGVSSPSTTDPILECFAAGAISSTSAMVWMPDSARAARLVRERMLPVGLHLNFTLAFPVEGVPDDVRRRQLELTQAFGPESWREPAGRAPAGSLIAAAVDDQLRQFREQFGEPTHLDGHHHVHVHPAVLERLPHELPIRPPLGPGSAGRGLGQRWLLRRFRSPDTCLAFERIHPALGGEGLQVLGEARRRVVEVMTHPAMGQREALLSAEWRAALAALQLGSYRDL